MHLAAGVLADEAHGALHIFRPDLDPAAAEADEGRAGGGKALEFLEGERRLADGHVPAVIDERGQAQLGRGGAGLDSAGVEAFERSSVEAQASAETRGGGFPPGRGLHADALLEQDGADFAEEVVGLLGGELDGCGFGAREGGFEARVEAAGAPEFGEEEFLGLFEAAAFDDRGIAGEGPEIGGIDGDGGRIGGLQPKDERPAGVRDILDAGGGREVEGFFEPDEEAPLAAGAAVFEAANPAANAADHLLACGGRRGDLVCSVEETLGPGDVRVGGVAAFDGFAHRLVAEDGAALGIGDAPEHVVEDGPGVVVEAIDDGAPGGGCGGSETKEALGSGIVVEPGAPRGAHGAAELLREHRDDALLSLEMLREGDRGRGVFEPGAGGELGVRFTGLEEGFDRSGSMFREPGRGGDGEALEGDGGFGDEACGLGETVTGQGDGAIGAGGERESEGREGGRGGDGGGGEPFGEVGFGRGEGVKGGFGGEAEARGIFGPEAQGAIGPVRMQDAQDRWGSNFHVRLSPPPSVRARRNAGNPSCRHGAAGRRGWRGDGHAARYAVVTDVRRAARPGNEGAGTRTRDPRIKSPLLYQLSYALACASRDGRKEERERKGEGNGQRAR